MDFLPLPTDCLTIGQLADIYDYLFDPACPPHPRGAHHAGLPIPPEQRDTFLDFLRSLPHTCSFLELRCAHPQQFGPDGSLDGFRFVYEGTLRIRHLFDSERSLARLAYQEGGRDKLSPAAFARDHRPDIDALAAAYITYGLAYDHDDAQAMIRSFTAQAMWQGRLAGRARAGHAR